ncbi:MAG: hypothetical protein M1828_002386 [Chrysothrix sp. TS-e1954]|nr:MAG: hypothetical protein M1828_002386 [Chrysothrix sp. TS-e1954]
MTSQSTQADSQTCVYGTICPSRNDAESALAATIKDVSPVRPRKVRFAAATTTRFVHHYLDLGLDDYASDSESDGEVAEITSAMENTKVEEYTPPSPGHFSPENSDELIRRRRILPLRSRPMTPAHDSRFTFRAEQNMPSVSPTSSSASQDTWDEDDWARRFKQGVKDEGIYLPSLTEVERQLKEANRVTTQQQRQSQPSHRNEPAESTSIETTEAELANLSIQADRVFPSLQQMFESLPESK